jgi:hypothetical protein
MRGREVFAGGVMGAALIATLGNTPAPDVLEEEITVTLAVGERLSGSVELVVDQTELYRDIQASVIYRPRRAALAGGLASGERYTAFDLSRGSGFALVEVSQGLVEVDTGMPVSTRYEATLTLDNLWDRPVDVTVSTRAFFEQGEEGTLSVDYSVDAMEL